MNKFLSISLFFLCAFSCAEKGSKFLEQPIVPVCTRENCRCKKIKNTMARPVEVINLLTMHSNEQKPHLPDGERQRFIKEDSLFALLARFLAVTFSERQD